MKVAAGEVRKTYFGEEFGPLQESDGKYSLKFYCVKFGQVFTFHENGRYSNDIRHRHFLDLVA